MNKRQSLKSSYVIRIVAVLLTVFLVVSFVVTWNDQKNAKSKVNDDLYFNFENFITELELTDTIDPSSGKVDMDEVHAFLNLMIFQSYDPTMMAMGAGVYKVDYEKIDEYIDEPSKLTPVMQNVNTLSFREGDYDNDDYKYGRRIIILDRVCSKEQINKIENFMKKNTESFISIIDMRGYIDGIYFYPTKMTIGWESENNIKIQTSYRDDSKEEIEMESSSDVVLTTDSGKVYGTERLVASKKELKSVAEDFLNYGKTYYTGDLLYLADGYAVLPFMKNSFWMDSIKKFLGFYGVFLAVLCIAGMFLVMEFDNTVGSRLKMEQRRRNIMDSLAHEMKTPLAVIRNYSEVLLDSMETEKEQRFLKKIVVETETLNDAIISVLDLSKMEAGTYPMELSSINISELAEATLANKRILFDKKNVSVETDIKSTSRIVVDERLVASIIGNYLSNAATHTAQSGKVSLKVVCEKNEAYIEVYNQGNPIAKKDIERIWDSFYGRKDINKESSGLGLAIVRNACQLHDGSCGCFNENDGVIFWAKIKSMENSIEEIEEKTGDVTGLAQKGVLHKFKAMVLMSIFCAILFFTAVLGDFGSGLFYIDYPYDVILKNLIKCFVLVKCAIGLKLVSELKENDGIKPKRIQFFAVTSIIFNILSILSDVAFLMTLSRILGIVFSCMYMLMMASLMQILQQKIELYGNKDKSIEIRRILLMYCILFISFIALSFVNQYYSVVMAINNSFLVLEVLFIIALFKVIRLYKKGTGNIFLNNNDKKTIISVIGETCSLRYPLSVVKLYTVGLFIMGIGQVGSFYWWSLFNPIIQSFSGKGIEYIIAQSIMLFGAIVIAVSVMKLNTYGIISKGKFIVFFNIVICILAVINSVHHALLYNQGVDYNIIPIFEEIILTQYVIVLILCNKIFSGMQYITLSYGEVKLPIWLKRFKFIFTTLYCAIVVAFAIGAITGVDDFGNYNVINLDGRPLLLIPYTVASFAWMRVYRKYRERYLLYIV